MPNTAVACPEDGSTETGSIDRSTPGAPVQFQIYLPPCYKQEASRSYPVLYLLHAAGGSPLTWNHYGAAEIANRLIRSGQAPPFILVTPGLSSDKLSPTNDLYTMLAYDFVPQIDSRFRTLADRQHRAIAGASFGGFVAGYVGFKFPDKFGSVGVFGAGLIDQQTERFNNWITATPPEQRPRVLIDIGQEDGIISFTTVLTQTLPQHDIPYTLIMKPGGHNYEYWASHLETYLLWFAGGW